MRLAIMADSHDNLANLKKTLVYLNRQGIKLIIHCGDIASDETLEKMVNFFPGNIYFTFGNADNIPLAKTLPGLHQKSPSGQAPVVECRAFTTGQVKLNFCDKFGEIEIDDKKIAFTHFPSQGRKLAKSGKYDLVFYGHTNKPWIQQMQINADISVDQRTDISVDQRSSKSVLLVNPGNLCGVFYKATFAVYDTRTNKLELKILELL